MKLLNKIWKNNRSLIVFICLMSVFRSAIADWYEVPTGSMQPTIVEGDRIFTNKMAYDLKVPFTKIPLIKISQPNRGDIIVFDSIAANNRLIKRVVGIPGDNVEFNNNVLIINGLQLTYSPLDESLKNANKIEDLLGVKHQIRVSKRPSPIQSFDAITIPDGYYLAMGDNRDNSADSRTIGFVPHEELLGKATRVIMSLDYDDYYLPRKNRYFTKL
ncbi:signal peptidase I [Pseudoalteromonas sp. H105]|uniref:signal peptidase I n=1 Tax=Pseudoalteromonas sp. H105 TaxID=1348393 RepID=UPI000731F887|nr:signal peptidase I [Pseudoalteromonas sp. H105]KTF18056.1 S26 family signal peptidase [Pseudoalteromonas sp. H105]